MNARNQKHRYPPTLSAHCIPLGAFVVLTGVFFSGNVPADEPAGPIAPGTTDLVFAEPSESPTKTDQPMPEKESVVPVLGEKVAAARAGEESTIPPPAIQEGVIRIKVQGSYEVTMGRVGVVRGEGTTTLELDGAQLDRLFHELEDLFGGSELVRRDIVDRFISLPSTIRSTNETLRMLSDPETQQALRQVESLLRLLPKTTSHAERPLEAHANEE
ncbi:hypothetical protein [Rhodopirellula sp. P2]|uniref:hypothetical protein n=1 Tax=Rhodopirellula sp. P2 TaxID=2127060 RepID=UPI00236792A6|nr:hypothetical protein [Rhodopirellula sp. P2]WDQ15180.1 hypothetical protein PSR62_16210 [Rhodopirellula sp. P2]